MTKPHPEALPGKKEQRVFIGGQYDFMPTLREIARFVCEISSPDKKLIPIIPYDFMKSGIPETETMEWDLSILANCRYAIFDLSGLGAQLVEMQEADPKYIDSLIVYPVRERRNEPERGQRTVLSFGLPHFGYRTFYELKGIVWRFLTEAPVIGDYTPRIMYDPTLDCETRRIRVLLATGREGRAEDILKKLVRCDPYRRALELWLQLAVVGHCRDNDGLTEDALNEAIKIAGEDSHAKAEVAYCQGTIYWLKNKLEDAKSYLESADALNPGVGWFLMRLGYVNWLLKDTKAAINNTKKALDDESIPDPLVTIIAINNLAYFYCEEACKTGDAKIINKAYELTKYLPAHHHVFRSKNGAWLETRGFAAKLMAKHLAADQPHEGRKAREAWDIARTALEEARTLEPENDYIKKQWREVLELEKELPAVATTDRL
jgi:tetratricopeptide (TPR) repeat protein